MNRSLRLLPWLATLAVAIACGSAEETGADSGSAQNGGSGGTSSDATSGNTGAGTTNGSGANTSASGGSGGIPEGFMPSFETDIIPIFDSSCGTDNNDCHNEKAFAANEPAGCIGWLSLLNAPLGSVTPQGQPTNCPDLPLYDRLMKQSWQCYDEAGDSYVVPCDPDASYLMKKLKGENLCNISQGQPSDPMPVGAMADPVEVETIRLWIEQGAKKDDGSGTTCDG